MHRAKRDNFQDQQIQRALRKIGFGWHSRYLELLHTYHRMCRSTRYSMRMATWAVQIQLRAGVEGSRGAPVEHFLQHQDQLHQRTGLPASTAESHRLANNL